jgi:hypothetical protein
MCCSPARASCRSRRAGIGSAVDMDAALMLAAARGCSLAELSELLPAAESGSVEAVRAERSPK